MQSIGLGLGFGIRSSGFGGGSGGIRSSLGLEMSSEAFWCPLREAALTDDLAGLEHRNVVAEGGRLLMQLVNA